MALLWMEGFDEDVLSGQRYDVYDAGTKFEKNTTVTRYGSAGSLKINQNSTTNADLFLRKYLPFNSATAVAGVAFRFESASTNQAILTFSDGDNASRQMRVYLNSNDTLSVQRDQTTLATTTQVLKPDTWYFIELKVTIDNSAGSYELRVNGQNVLSASGVDTDNTGSGQIEFIVLADTGTSAGDDSRISYFDNLYVVDDTGTDVNDFLGEISVDTIRPDGDGDVNNFVGSDGNSNQNWRLVDEVDNDGDTTYVESNTSGEIDLYTFENMTSTPTTSGIYGLQLENLVSKSDAGFAEYRNILRTNSTNYFGSGNYPSYNDYESFYSVWEINPDTTGVWTEQEINTIQGGTKVDL